MGLNAFPFLFILGFSILEKLLSFPGLLMTVLMNKNNVNGYNMAPLREKKSHPSIQILA